jgi:hypothetical protein
MFRRRLLSLVVLFALIPVAAGCGDDKKDSGGKSASTTASVDKTAYQGEIRTILTSVGTAGSALGTAAKSSKSATDIAAALQNFQASVNTAADNLGKLKPPNADAKAGQDELEQVLREIAQGVQPSIEAAKKGDKAKFTTEFRTYQTKLATDYRGRLTAAGGKIDQALAKK